MSGGAAAVDGNDTLSIMPLGAGAEVGRSCVVLRFKGKTVLFDCGVHPAYSGLAALPFFDEIDPSEIDIVLVTHFHLDHCAGLPYLMTQTNFNPRARIFMTHPTKAVYRTLISDFVRVGSSDFAGILYTDADLGVTMSRIECLDYHQQIDVAGVRISAYNAGHVLGAAMFMVEIAGVRVLYTGDFSRQQDRHLMEAEVPPMRPDVLVSESTYGVQVHEPRRVREARFTQRVAEIVRRGGRCLLPVFALGRAQELLLILEEYWALHPELQEIPIYYSSSIAKRCMAVYQTYINMMNENIRQRHRTGNPFAFKYVSNIKSLDQFDDAGPCVFMASPGMLQSGLSRKLFERWCTERRNGVILPGYSVAGTLAKYILTEPSTVPRQDGQQVPMRCSVDYITFSAHSDFMQTSGFIEACHPSTVVLVHGEANEMQRLAHALNNRFNKRESMAAAAAGAQNQVALQGSRQVESLGEAAGAAARGDEAETRVDGRSADATADPASSSSGAAAAAAVAAAAVTADDTAVARDQSVSAASADGGRAAEQDRGADAGDSATRTTTTTAATAQVRGAGAASSASGASADSIRIFTPKNTRAVNLEFRGEATAKAIGALAAQRPEPGTPVSGVLLRRDYRHTLVDPSEIETYTTIKTARIRQRLVVPLNAGAGDERGERSYAELARELSAMFDGVVHQKSSLSIFDLVVLSLSENEASVVVQWESSQVADAIVDAVVALVMARSTEGNRDGADAIKEEAEEEEGEKLRSQQQQPLSSSSSSSSLRQVSQAQRRDERVYDPYRGDEVNVIRRLLTERFGVVSVAEGKPHISKMVIDLYDVSIDHDAGTVTCESEAVRERVELALRRIHAAVMPIPDYYCGACC